MIKIAILGILLAGLWWSVASLERRSLYFPIKEFEGVPHGYGLTAEEVWITTIDGRKINGWWIPAASALKSEKVARLKGSPNSSTLQLFNTSTVLLSHGNAGNISHRLDKAMRLHRLGFNVLLYDYAGYGKSEGSPSEKATYADAEAAYRYLRDERRVTNNEIILYGESLGCAVATELALRHPEAAGLILESPFTSTMEMARRVFPWLPVKLIVRYRYDNLAKIPAIRMPLLILHSPHDEIVPYEMGQRLYRAAAGPKDFADLVGSHNEGYVDSGDHYIQAIRDFVERRIKTKREVL